MNREMAEQVVRDNQNRRAIGGSHQDGKLKGKKWAGGASTDTPWASRVKITDKDGNVRYEPARRYTTRRDHSATGRFRVSQAMKKRIRERDKVCQICGTDKAPFHVDHIRPYSKGGWNVEGNLQLLCALCNIRKGATWSSQSSG